MRRFLLLILICLSLYAGVFLALAWVTDVGELKTDFAHVNYKGKGHAVIHVSAERPAIWTNLGNISKIAVAAIVISEDDAFYQHNGYDINQMKASFEKDFAEHRFARGGSTITQQVVKNVYLTGEKSLWRKAREIVLALRLERQVGKHKILETYLNIAEFGEGLYGIGPASRFYFQKAPSELTAKEGAFLAMLLPSPRRYSVSYRKHMLTPYASSIIASILEKLHVTGRLSDEEYSAELVRPLSFEQVQAQEQAPLPILPNEDEEASDDDSEETSNK